MFNNSRHQWEILWGQQEALLLINRDKIRKKRICLKKEVKLTYLEIFLVLEK